MRPDRFLLRLLLFTACLAAPGAALAQSATCQALRNELAGLTRAADSRAGVYLNAARRQDEEMRRLDAYGRALGCDHTRFFIFGSDPPPQCADVAARMGRMQANLARLRQRAVELGGAAAIGARRRQAQAAIRQYCDTAQLSDAAVPEAQPAAEDPYAQQPGADDPYAQQPLDADGQGDADAAPAEAQPPLPPGKTVCVRMCDGYFFPLATAGDLGPSGATQMCQAQCPGAETRAFSMGHGDDISQAVGPDGGSYTDIPNALRYQKTRVRGCSCRREGESWGQALRGAQDMLGGDGGDIVVDAKKAREMSRPAPPGRSGEKRAASTEAKASPPARDKRPLARGPDGKRDVRVIAPAAP